MLTRTFLALLIIFTASDCAFPVAKNCRPRTRTRILPPGSTNEQGIFLCIFTTSTLGSTPHLTYKERRPTPENMVSMTVKCANGIWRFTCPANQYRLFFNFGDAFSLGPFLADDPEPLFIVYPQSGVKTWAHVTCDQKITVP